MLMTFVDETLVSRRAQVILGENEMAIIRVAVRDDVVRRCSLLRIYSYGLSRNGADYVAKSSHAVQ